MNEKESRHRTGGGGGGEDLDEVCGREETLVRVLLMPFGRLGLHLGPRLRLRRLRLRRLCRSRRRRRRRRGGGDRKLLPAPGSGLESQFVRGPVEEILTQRLHPRSTTEIH